MLWFCKLLDHHLNSLIFILAMFEIGLAVISFYELQGLKNKIKKLNTREKRKLGRARRLGKGKVESRYEDVSEKDWYEFDEFLKAYQKKSIPYNTFSLIIQLFTLLGILGTVAGLYVAINSNQDIYDGVKFALSSTVLGIVFAVIFKIFDIIFTSAFIHYIEDGIDRYEKEFRVNSEDANVDMMKKKTVEVSTLEETMNSKKEVLSEQKSNVFENEEKN